jgi:hypothetical protein
MISRRFTVLKSISFSFISVFGILQIKERKKDYNSTAHFKPKDRIAHEILGSVHANHGRFVR